MIILTGARGFIGSHFLRHLDGRDVYPVTLEDAFTFLEGFRNWGRVELIVHQGAISSTVETDVEKIHRYNVHFTLQLFQKAILYRIPVKYASSASVYGRQEKRATGPSDAINPLNFYAISKVQIDYWVRDNLEKFALIQGFRYFNVYGEGEDHKGDQASPVSKFARQIRNNGVLKLFEGSDQLYRDFICVDDIVNIVLNNNAGNGIYDLGTGTPVSFQHVAEIVAEKENGKIDYIPFPDHLKGKYQDYTCANMEWLGKYKFKTVSDYLKK